MALYTDRLGEALKYAADGFAHTPRKCTEVPYLTHLLQVTAWVGESGGDEDQMIAAVLHDYLEDIPGSSVGELEARFGARVARLVQALSDSTDHPKPPWRERKLRYLAHLRGEPAEVKLISACDKLHNASSILRDYRVIGEAIWDRFRPPREETLWYYRAVTEALAEGWPHPRVDELRGVVRAIHDAADQPWPGAEAARSAILPPGA